MATAELQQFLGTLRSSDPRAVEELLRQLDPFLRKVIRLRLIDGRLRRVMDTTDVFHSLLKDFLSQPSPSANGAVGENDSSTGNISAGLSAYLAAAVRHKIATRTRKERRHAGSLPPEWEPTSPDRPPGRQVEDQDFAEAIRKRLSEGQRVLFNLKAKGLTWPEIARSVGGRADALRMRLTRALAVILGELGCQG
jgi:hypothetical protein